MAESEIRIEATHTGWIVRDGALEIGPFFSREEAREAADQIVRQRFRLGMTYRRPDDKKPS